MDYKEILETGIAELSKEPSNIYEILNNLFEDIKILDKQEILERLNDFDKYAYEYLSKEEWYAKKTNFPKIALLISDHNYYRATYYRIRYHFTYFDVNTRKFNSILSYGIHLADNLKEWLDFHLNTLDEELIEHLKMELQKLNTYNL